MKASNPERERRLEDIAAAKVRGICRGRRPGIDPAAMRQLRDRKQLGPSPARRLRARR